MKRILQSALGAIENVLALIAEGVNVAFSGMDSSEDEERRCTKPECEGAVLVPVARSNTLELGASVRMFDLTSDSGSVCPKCGEKYL